MGDRQIPWAKAYSTWYHQYIASPIQAPESPSFSRNTPITDRGTYLPLSSDHQPKSSIIKAGSNNADDLLLNPCHLLIGSKIPNAANAQTFAKWLVDEKGEQQVLADFRKNGEVLYSGASTK